MNKEHNNLKGQIINKRSEKQISCFWGYLPNHFSRIPNWFSNKR